MIDDADLGTFKEARQIVLLEWLCIDVDGRIARLMHAMPDGQQLLIAVDEDGFHSRVTRS
jgi:hypothetical protein